MALLDGKVAIITGAASGMGAAQSRLFIAEGARVNQIGVFLGMRAVRSPMQKRGGGAIVNIASGSGLRGFKGQTSYAATKWAVRGMTRCVANEYAPLGIRVNGIYTGAIDTPMLGNNSEEMNAQLVAATPAGRVGSVEEIARATVFLASDLASYCVGAELAADGGITL